MRSNLQLFLFLCIVAVTTHGQEVPSPALNLGDPAPPLQVRAWIKGEPVQRFEKGKVYVVEFWATWCGPCTAAMPHLSALASEYKDRVTILGIDILEAKTSSTKKVKTFVDSMGHRMDYHVAADDNNFMTNAWLYASGQQGIPAAYVINQEGRMAWLGNPTKLDEVLPKILNNTWEINKAFAKRRFDKRLSDLNDSAYYELLRFMGNPDKTDDPGKPDSALLMINEMVRKEPKLKYAPSIAAITFSSLLKTNMHKAYEFGKALLVTSAYDDSTYSDPNYYIVFGNIKEYSDKLNLSGEIYLLGAEAYQMRINADPEIVFPDFYNNMAEFYWRACDQSKAIITQKKAIEALKQEKKISATKLAVYEFRLQQYFRLKNQDGSLLFNQKLP